MYTHCMPCKMSTSLNLRLQETAAAIPVSKCHIKPNQGYESDIRVQYQCQPKHDERQCNGAYGRLAAISSVALHDLHNMGAISKLYDWQLEHHFNFPRLCKTLARYNATCKYPTSSEQEMDIIIWWPMNCLSGRKWQYDEHYSSEWNEMLGATCRINICTIPT